MRALKRIFTNWWVLSLLALTVFLLVFLLLLPWLVYAFEPWSVRTVIAALLIAGWVALAVWRIVSRRKASGRIEKSLEATVPEGEGAILAERMRSALAALRKSGGRGRDYLYSRPWYVIIGPPGAGKTTALENSGLRFLADGGAPSSVGGTRNVNFIFADEAVLIDTAGRYTSQDSDTVRDREAWKQFLDLLRKNRPLQPINGVIVALGIDDLAQADLAAIDRHARIVHDRLRELQTTLSLHLPVYVLFTKADLVAGFTEFYDDLDVEGRRAVLGSTLDWKPEQRPGTAEWTASFDELSNAVQARMAKRLQEELDSRRRSLVLGFPVQINALRARIVSFLSLAFPQDDPLSTILPRGFYFTSGTQQGTPFDRVIGRLAALYDAPQARGAHGRAYFINRLLKEVMIGEAGLVRRTSQVRRRDRVLLAAGLAGIALFSVLAITAWTVSYFRNREFQANLAVAAQAADQQRARDGIVLTSVGDANFGITLPLLDHLRTLPRGYEESRNSGPPLAMTFGLYQSGLSDSAVAAYTETLKRTLLPRSLWRLESVLHSSDMTRVYNALKVYLMLGGLAPPGKFKSDAIRRWTVSDWSETFAGDEKAPIREPLARHLDAMLEDNDLWSVWQKPDHLADVDANLIDAARQTIANIPIPDRAFEILKDNAAADGPDLTPASHFSPREMEAFADPATVRNLRISYVFTAEWYRKAYEIGLGKIYDQINDDRWVYGRRQDLARGEITSLKDEIALKYAGEYVRKWQAVADAARPVNDFSNLDVMAVATGEDSPITWLLLQVRNNTQLTKPGTATSLAKLAGYGGVLNKINKIERAADPSAVDPAKIIDDRFKDLRKGLDSGKWAKFLKSEQEVAKANAALKQSVPGEPVDSSARTKLADATAEMRANAAELPGALQAPAGAATRSAVKENQETQTKIATATIITDYQLIERDCSSAVGGHYPFDAEGTPADSYDLNQAFGKMHDFIDSELKPYLDQSRASWKWKESDPAASAFHYESAIELQRADRIHDLLARGVGLNVSATGWAGDATTADLTVGGVPLHFDKNAAAPQSYQWNPNGQINASVILKNKDGKELQRVEGDETVWALFRVFEKGKFQNETRSGFDVTFPAEGADNVTFHVAVRAAFNPFGVHNSNWVFRCPAQL